MLSSRGVARLSRKALQARRANAALFSTAPGLLRAAGVPVAQQRQISQKPSLAAPGM